MSLEDRALEYHSSGRSGKIEVVPTKPCARQRDLSLAYTPGVAVPCLKIHDDPDEAYKYTAKGNLVAVVSNGTAVLGLGDIGPLAGKPVMEGKGVLFKRFADIDVFDIEVDTKDPEALITFVKLLEPTFGGINLEDIKAPECFIIEERLKEQMNIPVFHDDQHGTAIISGAALLNALEIVEKQIDQVRVVFNGAGAAGISCAQFYLSLGVRRENLILCDSKGTVYEGRTDGMNSYKARFTAQTRARTLGEALEGADVFVGASVAGCVTPKMVQSMGDKPIVFAMANPDPEISYEAAKAARPDVIVATGRSDYPNQVNNVLGFPFIFRGALDVRATRINEEMKLAATHALAALAKEDVPESVLNAYGLDRLHFGPDYLIPKPFDTRVLTWESVAVARAAMETGVARIKLDLHAYRERLEKRLGRANEIMRMIINRARQANKRVVFPEGYNEQILRACHVILDEKVAQPILLGKEERIHAILDRLELKLDGVTILQPAGSEKFETYVDELFRLRQRKGVTRADAQRFMRNPDVYAAMMVHMDDADSLVAGLNQQYPDTVRHALQIIGTRPEVSRVAGLSILVFKNDVYFLADTTINIDPNAQTLAEIAICAATAARRYHIEPRVAMLSFSNFGSAEHAGAQKMRDAVRIVREREPGLMIDGEMQADTAVVPELIDKHYPFSRLKGGANVLIFPDLQSANAAYKLLSRLGGAQAIGPLLMGMRKPVHILQHGCEVKDILYLAALGAVQALERDPGPVA